MPAIEYNEYNRIELWETRSKPSSALGTALAFSSLRSRRSFVTRADHIAFRSRARDGKKGERAAGPTCPVYELCLQGFVRFGLFLTSISNLLTDGGTQIGRHACVSRQTNKLTDNKMLGELGKSELIFLEDLREKKPVVLYKSIKSSD
ncbi:hypothetical protein THAOC_32448 [Thalassiosira oceanica]|uniref:Uncharacterized protein n=1 Tax=Thalassiosira oceanica TaxID=159749 RepID=K0RIN7_THAOC|nr:hypothetical protein THAOC_32448 [Thalassiosira oceanica]|eukprot:EJK48731.1 hypothetical protein THAOC_32448 [Thalassiosira oceanica]